MTEATPTARRGRGRPRNSERKQAGQEANATAGLSVPPAPEPPPTPQEQQADARRAALLADPPPMPADPAQTRPDPEMREDGMRGEMRADDPRAEAERIANEWFAHLDTLGPQRDKYAIDPTEIPDGWTYEWRTFTVTGKEDPQYQVYLQRSGWRAVPASRHPQFLPKGSREQVILVDGMMLMERPVRITEYMKQRDKQNANAPIDTIRQKLAGAPKDTMERTNPRVGRDYGPMNTEIHRGRVNN